MGQAASRLTRPFRNFNIENRASKVIDKKTTFVDPAPKHESTKQKLTQFREENPELLETVKTKSEELHERLRHIYVDSKDAPIQITASSRPLPLSREAKPDTDLGVMDINYEVPQGKAELKTILNFIGQSQLNPKLHTAKTIAENHKLDEAEVQNVLKHFYALQVFIPKEMHSQNKQMGSILNKQLSAGKLISPFQPKLPTEKTNKESSVLQDRQLSPDKNS